MLLQEMLDIVVEKKASDLHLIRGVPPTIRIDGDLSFLVKDPLTEQEINDYLEQIVSDRVKREKFLVERELDFAYEMKGKARFRINAYFQRDSMAFSIRHLVATIPKLEDLNLPEVLKDLVRKPNGLVLVTGPTGSGKSTTLAAMIDRINELRSVHVVTVEDPIEYVYVPKKSIISQREVGDDTLSFNNALRHVLRQDPDVILIGEMRDQETMQAAITAAETGHLVFSTLHTTSAAQTIDRIIDVFPPYQQSQIRSQLATTLQAVVTQRLLKRTDAKGRIPVTEVMVATAAVRNLIREGKTYQLYSTIELGSEYGMHTTEQKLNKLLLQKAIRWDDAIMTASIVEYIRQPREGGLT
jgi:twitching motility protein PilT